MSADQVRGRHENSALRIGIDYTAAVRQRAGIGRYTRNLVHALVDLDEASRYRLFVAGGRGALEGEKWTRPVELCRVPISDRWLHILWQRLRVPIPVQLATGRLDLFYSPDFVLPPVGRTPAVVTIHDLSFLRVPQCFVPGFASYLRRAVEHAVARAERVLADSLSTCRDLVELLGVDESRITVIYPGVEERFRPVADSDELARVRAKYRLPGRFVLGLGTLQPRKNFATLVRAFGLAIRRAGPEGSDLTLVIGGEKGWLYDDLLALPRELGLGERVRLIGYVADGDLPALYSMSSAFAFPSLYEGFGLPVLEAMRCGVPVVCADNSSLPEVVGEGGLLVNAGDLEGLADSLSRVVYDTRLRDTLVSAGFRQASGFTWGRAAAQLRSVLTGRTAGDGTASHSHVNYANLTQLSFP